jgi:two-component system OmpR family response regulator
MLHMLTWSSPHAHAPIGAWSPSVVALTGLSIFLVEDDADTRELLQIFLEGEGATVRVASTAAEARAAIQEQAPDVLLADITLPDEDGYAFVASLRTSASTRDIPAIALTGHVDAESRGRAVTAGFQKFVPKPYNLDSLALAILTLTRPKAPSDP